MSEESDPAFIVRVGIGDIYQKQLDQEKQLSRVAGILEELGNTVKTLVTQQTEIGKVRGVVDVMQAQGAGAGHEKRISFLERRMAVVTAFAGLASLLATGCVSIIAAHFT